MTGRNSRDFWDLAADIIDDDELMDKTNQIGDDLEMIKAVKSLFSWTPSTLNDNESFKKSSAKSMKYAEEAIKAGNAREAGRSLKLANMITAYAQDAGDLALGHFLRFMLIQVLNTGYHLKIEELEFCVKSRQLPKKMNPNITLESSLGEQISPNHFSRKQMTQMLSQAIAKSESEDVKKHFAVIKEKDEKKIKFTRDHFTLKSPNPKAPALEDFVEIKYDSVKGRVLVVTKDVPAGTTLIVEKPFVSRLGNIFELEINRCHHCFKRKFVPIPCPNCVFVLYCSEKCLEESKEYHKQYECPVFPDLHAVLDRAENNVWYFFVYSTICTFGPQKMFDAFQKQQLPKKKSESAAKSKSKDELDDCEIPGVDPETGIYDSSSFYTVTHMSKLRDVCSTEDALIALALTKILEARTDFFEQLESELKSRKVKTQFQDFIAQSITNIANSYGVHPSEEQEWDDGKPCGDSIIYAFSLQPTHKLSNHSCEGNLFVSGTSNLKGQGTAAATMRDVKKGEELCRIYNTPFQYMKKQVRQKLLLKKYSFKCECAACLNDWPLMKKMEAEKDRPKFCCPLCSHKIPPQPEMMTQENFDKIALNSGNNFICPECKSEYKEEELMTQFKRHSMALTIAENLIKKGAGQETLPSLKAASTFFQNYLIPSSYYQVKCLELIPNAIDNSITAVYN